ncbi:MAG: SpoIIE family protein phosphatase, partial [Magnetococcales bacterium]|nr:SpoIIE family protein phosphatase [Magnetococcales bacterium]
KAMTLISDSIHYASLIQRSILPDEGMIQTILPNHFIVWQPRDVVGGDIYWCSPWGEGNLIILGDCTGHGVPGAFMTLIANGALGQAMLTTTPGELATLITTLHGTIQDVLMHDHDLIDMDDGLELGACYLSSDREVMRFVGANISLFYQDGDCQATELRSNRTAIGYRTLPKDLRLTEHILEGVPGQRFFLTTDGMLDQIGGMKRQGFGKRRFLDLLENHKSTPIQKVGEELYQSLVTYQGKESRRDDVTIIGFTL